MCLSLVSAARAAALLLTLNHQLRMLEASEALKHTPCEGPSVPKPQTLESASWNQLPILDRAGHINPKVPKTSLNPINRKP